MPRDLSQRERIEAAADKALAETATFSGAVDAAKRREEAFSEATILLETSAAADEAAAKPLPSADNLRAPSARTETPLASRPGGRTEPQVASVSEPTWRERIEAAADKALATTRNSIK